jgi:hypothetical protein
VYSLIPNRIFASLRWIRIIAAQLFENTGPSRPDFSKPKYTLNEHIWYQKETAMPIAGIYGPDDFGNPAPGRPVTPARRRVNAAEQARALPTPSLQWSPEVERATAHLYERVKNVISPIEAVHGALHHGDQ